MVRHYLINTLVNWRESLRINDIHKAYNEIKFVMKYVHGMTKAETLEMIAFIMTWNISGTSTDIPSYESY